MKGSDLAEPLLQCFFPGQYSDCVVINFVFHSFKGDKVTVDYSLRISYTAECNLIAGKPTCKNKEISR